MDFLTEVEESTSSMRELKAAHSETIQELQKTRKILTMESRISKEYKVESSNCTCTRSSQTGAVSSPVKADASGWVQISCLLFHSFISCICMSALHVWRCEQTRFLLLLFASWSWSSCQRR